MGTVTYTASEQVYLSTEGRMVYAGEKFTVGDDAKPGKSWLDANGDLLPEVGAGGSRSRRAASEG